MSDLIPTIKVKLFLRIASEEQQHDELLKLLIAQCSRFIEEHCRRRFKKAQYTEVYDGDGTPTLFLDNYPVISVSGLSIDSVAYDSSDYVVYSEGRIRLVDGSVFTRGDQNVQVTYEAGYESVPEDVEMCCVELVAAKFKQIDSDRIGISSQSFGDQSVSFLESELTDKIKNVLNRYRKPAT